MAQIVFRNVTVYDSFQGKVQLHTFGTTFCGGKSRITKGTMNHLFSSRIIYTDSYLTSRSSSFFGNQLKGETPFNTLYVGLCFGYRKYLRIFYDFFRLKWHTLSKYWKTCCRLFWIGQNLKCKNQEKKRTTHIFLLGRESHKMFGLSMGSMLYSYPFMGISNFSNPFEMKYL